MPKRTRDELTNPSKRQRWEIDAVDTLAGVLNRVISIPVDVLSNIRMYLYRVTRPRIRFEGDRVFRFNYATQSWPGTRRVHPWPGMRSDGYPWAGTEWMRRRNVVVSRTMPGDTGTYFRYPNWTLIDRLHLGMPDPVPTTRGATMTYDIGRYWDNWDRLSDFVPYVRLHSDELFSGSHDGPIDLT